MVPVFLSPVLLWFTGLALLPLVVHLLNRLRLKVVRWGAYEFLLEVLRRQRKRIRYRELIMLFLRTGIILFLVLALARPALRRRPTNLLGPEPRSAVILLDNSYSMGRSVVGRTAFEEARHKALRILDGLESGSEVCVYLLNRLAVPVVGEPSTDVGFCSRQLARTTLSDEITRPEGALRTVAGLLERMTLPKTTVYVISDFQASAWGDDDVTGALKSVARSAYVELLPVGEDAANLAVVNLQIEGSILVAGKPSSLRCSIANRGSSGAAEVVVSLYDGEAKVSSAMVEKIPAGGSAEVFLPVLPGEGGVRAYSARTAADVLAVDNTRRLAAEVYTSGLPLLLLQDAGAGMTAGGGALNEEGFYIIRALAPGSAGGAAGAGELPDVYRIESVFGTPPEGTRWADYRAVVFADVAQLPRDLAGGPGRYMESGGTILVFVGERASTSLEEYEGFFRDLWPVSMAGYHGRVGLEEENAAHISSASIEGDVLSYFRRKPRYGLLVSEPSFYRYPVFKVRESPAVRVLARFGTGDAAIVETAPESGGRLYVFAGDAQLGRSAWNNWAAYPGFLVSLRRILDSSVMLTEHSRRNRLVGQDAEVVFPGLVPEKVRVHYPDEKIEEVYPSMVGGMSVLRIPVLSKAGFHISRPVPEGNREVLAVNTRPGPESDLSMTDLELLAGLSPRVSVWGRREEVAEKVLAQNRGYELWKTLFALLALMVVTEMILALLWSPARGWKTDEAVGGLTLRAPGAAGRLIEELGRQTLNEDRT